MSSGRLNYDKTGGLPVLFVRHRQELLICCTKILGNSEDAEDVVQMTFMHYLQRDGQFRGDSSVRTYLYSIAVNLCKNEMRKQQRRKSVSLDSCDKIEDSKVEDPELVWIVESALRSLKPSFRTPLVLCAMEGMSYGEISRILKISESGVRSRVHRAKKTLKKILEQRGVSQ